MVILSVMEPSRSCPNSETIRIADYLGNPDIAPSLSSPELEPPQSEMHINVGEVIREIEDLTQVEGRTDLLAEYHRSESRCKIIYHVDKIAD